MEGKWLRGSGKDAKLGTREKQEEAGCGYHKISCVIGKNMVFYK